MIFEDLIQIEEIRQLKARYFHRLDAKRWDEWADCFCEDVLIDTTQDGSPPIEGREAFRTYLAPLLEGVQTVHHGHASEIELTGPAEAKAIWSMEDHLFWPEDQGGRHLWGTGWYFENYKKGDDQRWRIQKMTLRRIRVEIDGEVTFPRD